MFREYIRDPIDPIPEEYIGSLNRLYNEPDYSLTCLGIAIFKDRIPDYQGIKGCFKNYTSESTCFDDLISQEENVTGEGPTLFYYTFNSKSDINESLVEHGYEINEKIGAFINTKAGIECVVATKKEKNVAAVFIASHDIKYYHLTGSFLSLLFPSLFEEKKLEEKDFNIIKALSKTDKNAFVQRIQEAVQPYIFEFRRMILTNMLKGLHEVKINAAKREMDHARALVEAAKNNYINEISNLNRKTVEFEGLKATENYGEPEEELVDYLSTTPEIHNVKVDGSKISFAVATFLTGYNSDVWETFSTAGHIFEGTYGNATLPSVFRNRKNRQILFDSIFCESPEFAIKICSNYRLDFNTCDISGSRTYDYVGADPIFKEYVPNPHFKNYTCFGGFGPRIIDALHERNYVGAINLCLGSAASINLEETENNFRPFLGWMMTSGEKVLRRADGVDMTPEEALVYLIDKEK